jgi:hypothetical protein
MVKMVKIWPYFHKSIWVANFILFSNFLKSFRWGIIPLDFLGFFPNQKMTSATLNTNFHIDLGRFVCDWTCSIQILEY